MRTQRHRNVLQTLTLMSLTALVGCGSENRLPIEKPAILERLAGSWEMDLSPKGDRSYVKELVVVPSKPGGNTFTGSVYSGSSYDNGLAMMAHGSTTFSFVSDEEGKLGGPYYWLGTLDSDRQMHGVVQSLTRKLFETWKAVKSPTTPPATSPTTKNSAH